MAAFVYQTQYIGLLWVAHFTSRPDGKQPDGTIEIELVSSRDGKRWRRADPLGSGAGGRQTRPLLLPRGPKTWDGMMIRTSTQPLLVGDTLHVRFGCS